MYLCFWVDLDPTQRLKVRISHPLLLWFCILALCVTTICCVYWDMHTDWLIFLYMSTQPISIHSTISVCGVTRLVSLQYIAEGGGGIKYVSRGKMGGCVSGCEWVCACVCIYLSQGATVSLRQHECGPVSLWHSSVRQALLLHMPSWIHTHLSSLSRVFWSHSCIIHL